MLTKYKRNETNLFDDLFFPFNQLSYQNDVMYDIMETDNDYVVEMMLPAFDKKDFNIKTEKNTLIIEGKRTVDENKYKMMRSFKGEFRKVFTIPELADMENISAKYENGVLMITIPKSEEKMMKRVIEVK